MEYKKNLNKYNIEVVEIQSMLNKALDNAFLLVKADSSLPSMLGDYHYFQTLPHRNYIPAGWNKINPDGYYGDITEKAVKCFQEFLYITPNGIVGDTTYSFLSQFSFINSGSIRVLGTGIQHKKNYTYNDDYAFIIHFESSIKSCCEDASNKIKNIIVELCKTTLSDKASNGHTFPVILYQIKSVLSTNFSTLQQAAFLDNIRNNRYDYIKINKSQNGATIPISKEYSCKSLKIRIKETKTTSNIDKIGKYGGWIATILLAFRECLQLLLNYEETDRWYELYKTEYYKAMDDLLFGSLAIGIVRVISMCITATSVTTGTVIGAGVGASAAGAGAIPGSLGGAGFGLLGGVAITIACIELIKILSICLITSLIALVLSFFYKLFALMSGNKQQLSQKILEPIFNNTVVLWMNDNRQ